MLKILPCYFLIYPFSCAPGLVLLSSGNQPESVSSGQTFYFYHHWPPIPLRLTAVQQQPLCFHTGMQGESWKVSYNQEVLKKKERETVASLEL